MIACSSWPVMILMPPKQYFSFFNITRVLVHVGVIKSDIAFNTSKTQNGHFTQKFCAQNCEIEFCSEVHKFRLFSVVILGTVIRSLLLILTANSVSRKSFCAQKLYFTLKFRFAILKREIVKISCLKAKRMVVVTNRKSANYNGGQYSFIMVSKLMLN